MKLNLKIDPKTEKWVKWRAGTFFSKEPETIAWINGFDDPKGIFWDIGANIGIYSLYCAKMHPNMQILAFEPMKSNFIRLWQNIFANDFINVTAHFAAFAAKTGKMFFNPGTVEVGSSGGQVGESGYPIKTICGELFAHHEGYPSYIKIDTDGNEWEILQGMYPGPLESCKLKSVLVEVNNHNSEIVEMMAECGFLVDAKLMSLINRPNNFNVIFTRK